MCTAGSLVSKTKFKFGVNLFMQINKQKTANSKYATISVISMYICCFDLFFVYNSKAITQIILITEIVFLSTGIFNIENRPAITHKKAIYKKKTIVISPINSFEDCFFGNLTNSYITNIALRIKYKALLLHFNVLAFST